MGVFLAAVGVVIAVLSGVATTTVIVACVISVVRDKLNARRYADVEVVHHPDFGWMFHLNHRGQVMHDGFYTTDAEAVHAAALEAERMRVNR